MLVLMRPNGLMHLVRRHDDCMTFDLSSDAQASSAADTIAGKRGLSQLNADTSAFITAYTLADLARPASGSPPRGGGTALFHSSACL